MIGRNFIVIRAKKFSEHDTKNRLKILFRYQETVKTGICFTQI